MRRKSASASEYPLKKILIILGIGFAVCTILGLISSDMIWSDFNKKAPPTSEHTKSEKTFKDETVYVYTDSEGHADEVTVDSYIINNKEKKYLLDKSILTDIENVVQSENLPEETAGGNLLWKLDGNDVSYEGDGKAGKLPVSIDVRYFLDGREIPSDSVRGVSGDLRIEIRYTSNENAKVKGRSVKVPYFALSTITFKSDFTDIQVSSGKVLSTGNTNIVICTAMPGASSILDSDASGFVTDTVTIRGTAKDLDKNAITTALSGDVLTYISDKTLENINLDKAVDGIDGLLKKILAISRKTAAAMVVVDKQVMPKIKATTHVLSKDTDKLAKETPAFLKKLRDAAGTIAATTDVVIYTIHTISDIVSPDDEEMAVSSEENSLAESAEAVNEYINGSTDEEGNDVPGLVEKLTENIESEQEALETMAADNPARAALEKSIETQAEIVNELAGTETEEGIAETAETTSEEAAAAEEKLNQINEMMTSGEWLREELQNGNIAEFLGEERAEMLEEYASELEDKSGNVNSVVDISQSVPYKTGALYTTVNDILSPKNQKSVIKVTKKIASGMRAVDKVTGKIGGIVETISKQTTKISNKMCRMYGDYVVDIIKTYNREFRGANSRIQLLKKAQEQAGVYSGLSKGMDGTSTYMFFVPIGTDSYNISNSL